MASNFLDNLNSALEKGEFNSEAAKKINEIDELADKKVGTKALDEIFDNAKIQNVSEEEALAINSEYEKKMSEIKKRDTVNAQLATLIDIEDMVKASIDDMMSFIEELDEKFTKEFEAEDPMFGSLHLKIEEIKSKYSSIV